MHPVNLCLPLNPLLQLGHTSKLFYEASVEEKKAFEKGYEKYDILAQKWGFYL